MAELTYRDWMVILGALLILAVVLDAWRRVLRERRVPLRMKLDEQEDGEGEEKARDVDLAWLKELPNGGARVVAREGEPEADSGSEDAPGASSPALETQAATAGSAAHSASEAANGQENAGQARPAAARSSASNAEPELFQGLSTSEEPENLDWLEALDAEQPETPAPAQLPRDVEPEVFMLNVVARRPEGFRGEDILHILLACDLRFGDMSFFHRHEQEAGRGPIQFSVANMLQPGVFDIDNMSDFNTQGLVFFLTLPGPEDMMKAFDYMLETAQTVARNLEGDVLDETRSVLTRQTLEHSRQQIRDLERRLLAHSR